MKTELASAYDTDKHIDSSAVLHFRLESNCRKNPSDGLVNHHFYPPQDEIHNGGNQVFVLTSKKFK